MNYLTVQMLNIIDTGIKLFQRCLGDASA